MKHIHIGKAQALTETYGNILEKKNSLKALPKRPALAFLQKGHQDLEKRKPWWVAGPPSPGGDMMDVEHIPGPGSLFAMDIAMDI